MSIDAVFKLSPDQYRKFQIAQADHGRLKIYEHAGYRWLSTQDGAIQSVLRIASHADLLLPTHAAMLMGLLFAEKPGQVLNLGFGTGAFERCLHQRMPAVKVISVDSDPAMVELARKYFFVPRAWPVQIQTAEAYLEQNHLRYDLILCDIFTGEHHPQCLFEAAFYDAASKHLTDAGILALNLYPRSENEMISILLVLRQSLPWIMLIKVPPHDNMVLLAGKLKPPADADLARRARRLAQTLNYDFDALLNQFERVPTPPGI